MILLLVILYALGFALTFFITLYQFTNGPGRAPDYYGPISKWLFENQIKGGFVGGTLLVFNWLLWPITLPIFALKK